MSNCTHKHDKAFSWLPTTLIHNEHKHECSCVKCYLSEIDFGVKLGMNNDNAMGGIQKTLIKM